MSTDDDEGVRHELPHSPGRLHDPLVFKGMKAGDADQAGPASTDPGGEAGAEPQVGDGHGVSPHPEAGPEVFEPQRLNPEERAEAEGVVARMGAQQEDVHVSFPGWGTASPAGTSLPI